MRNTTIAYTNPKGQIVIPKEYRTSLEIDENVALQIKVIGKSLVISPIENIITSADKENSYDEILKMTK